MVVGDNVTKQCNILHMGQNVLKLPPAEGGQRKIMNLIDRDVHTGIPCTSLMFLTADFKTINEIELPRATKKFKYKCEELPWEQLQTIVDNLRQYVCL